MTVFRVHSFFTALSGPSIPMTFRAILGKASGEALPRMDPNRLSEPDRGIVGSQSGGGRPAHPRPHERGLKGN
jgi:hypothetical protein